MWRRYFICHSGWQKVASWQKPRNEDAEQYTGHGTQVFHLPSRPVFLVRGQETKNTKFIKWQIDALCLVVFTVLFGRKLLICFKCIFTAAL